MVQMNNDFSPLNFEDQSFEIQNLRNKVIEIVKKLSEEDLYYLMEILKLTLRTED